MRPTGTSGEDLPGHLADIREAEVASLSDRVNRVCSMPIRCRIVAFRSYTLIGESVILYPKSSGTPPPGRFHTAARHPQRIAARMMVASETGLW